MSNPSTTALAAAQSAAASATSAAASATHAASLIQDPIDEALLGPINAAVAEAQALRDETAAIRNDVIDGFGLAYDTDGIPYLT